MEIEVLETKWFYRLVKVMYVFLLTVGLISVLCLGWALKPYKYINDEESYLICLHGLHSFKDAELYFPSDSIKFGSDYDKKSRDICVHDAIKENIRLWKINDKNSTANNQQSNGTGVWEVELPNGQIQEFPNNMPVSEIENTLRQQFKITPALARAELKRREMFRHPHQKTGYYEVNLEYMYAGSWISAIKLWFLGSLIVLLIFNVIKQSLLYIVYGKKFTFSW